MKPNNKQIKICELITEQTQFWQSTNDINSPTHYNDIEETIDNAIFFDDELFSKDEGNILKEKLFDLYNFVKSIK